MINLGKCVLDPVQEIEFLRLVVNSQTMTLLLPEEKIQGIRGITSGFDKTNRNSFFNHSNSVPITSTVLLFQQQQILSLKQTQPYLTLVKLTPMTKNELLWWVNNLRTLQWPIGYTTTETGPYSDRCIQKKAEGLYVEGSEQGVNAPRRNRIYMSISWNF